MTDTLLSNEFKTAPNKPGVYIMKSADGHVLYVGKASKLRSRLNSYLGTSRNKDPKTAALMRLVEGLDYIVTSSPSEALILESTLIKQYRPKYNVRLKDDKSYPYIKITNSEDFPRVFITRKVENDASLYFGPYANPGSVRKTLKLINRLFPYRSCDKIITGKDDRPCLEYHLNRCIAPCISAASIGDYRNVIDQVILFMEGKSDTVVNQLTKDMKNAAKELAFEKASIIRDQIEGISQIQEKQKVVSAGNTNYDVIGIAKNDKDTRIVVLFVRSGKLIGKEQFSMIGIMGESTPDLISDFVIQYYSSVHQIPDLLLLPCPISQKDIVEDMLTRSSNKRVKLNVPLRGPKFAMVQMALDNAYVGLNKSTSKSLFSKENLSAAMKSIKDKLDLPSIPYRIECYDISNIQGAVPVGSMVVFENGLAKPSSYRKFNIRTKTGIDDYAMMKEMIERRFKKIIDQPNSENIYNGRGDQSWDNAPDLVVIDGGKGHLNAVSAVFDNLGINTISLASLAKENEEIFLRDRPDPVILEKTSEALYLMQRLRDEAHRFAISHHRERRNRIGTLSILDTIPGIGPKRRNALLRYFGSVAKIREASESDIEKIPGFNSNVAKKIMEIF